MTTCGVMVVGRMVCWDVSQAYSMRYWPVGLRGMVVGVRFVIVEVTQAVSRRGSANSGNHLVLDSPVYRTALANQTAWSKANIANFKDMIRGVSRITISRGTGRGAALGIIRLRPPTGRHDTLRTALRDQLDPAKLDGIISMHLLENDPALSKPITDDPSAPNPGAGDWFILIDATDVSTVPAAMARFTDNAAIKPLVLTSGVYRLMWDLANSDLLRT